MWPHSRKDIMLLAGVSGKATVRRLKECLQICENMKEITNETVARYEQEFRFLLNYIQESDPWSYGSKDVNILARPGFVLNNAALLSVAITSKESYAISPAIWVDAMKLFGFEELLET